MPHECHKVAAMLPEVATMLPEGCRKVAARWRQGCCKVAARLSSIIESIIEMLIIDLDLNNSIILSIIDTFNY